MGRGRIRTGLVGIESVALATLVLTAVSQSPAAASHRNVTAVKGIAIGFETFNITLFGGVQEKKGPTPIVTLASDASNSPQQASSVGTASNSVQFGPAIIFTAASSTVRTEGALGTSGYVTSSADVQDINQSRVEIFGEDNYDCCIPVGVEEAGNPYNRLDPPDNSGIAPQPARPLTDVASTCTANESGVTGSSTITNGWLYLDSGWADSDSTYPEPAEPPGPSGGVQQPEHDPVKVLVPTNPAPNTTYAGHLHIARNHQDDYVIVFNEQIQNADGSLTVNGAHYYFGYTLQDGQRVVNPSAILKGDMVVGQSVCGVSLQGASASGTTNVASTISEPGGTVLVSATGVATSGGSYTLRLSTTASGCRTSTLVLGSSVTAAGTTINQVARTIPANVTAGVKFLCWAGTDDDEDHTAPVSITLL